MAHVETSIWQASSTNCYCPLVFLLLFPRPAHFIVLVFPCIFNAESLLAMHYGFKMDWCVDSVVAIKRVVAYLASSYFLERKIWLGDIRIQKKLADMFRSLFTAWEKLPNSYDIHFFMSEHNLRPFVLFVLWH